MSALKGKGATHVRKDTMALAYGMPELARNAHLSRQSVYRALSPGGNPTLQTLSAILKPLGLRITVEPIKKSA
jgi:probable addiction module antidote protein